MNTPAFPSGEVAGKIGCCFFSFSGCGRIGRSAVSEVGKSSIINRLTGRKVAMKAKICPTKTPRFWRLAKRFQSVWRLNHEVYFMWLFLKGEMVRKKVRLILDD